MAFGLKQINNPTPRSKSILFDVIVASLSVINAWMTTAAYISHEVSDIIGSIITGLLIPMLLVFKRFFVCDKFYTFFFI